MHYADIYCLLQKRKITLISIAKEEGVSSASITQVLRGQDSSFSIATAIAAKVDRSLETLWPGRYTTPSTHPLARHHNKKAAA